MTITSSEIRFLAARSHIETGAAQIDTKTLLTIATHIDAQAAQIAEQQLVIDQRNGECDRLINELAALREQKPVAYSYRYAGCETCEGFQDWRDELSSERPPEWMIETGKVTELQYLFKGPAPVAVPLELLAAMEEVIRISDREHEAWHRAKAAIEVLRLNSGSK